MAPSRTGFERLTGGGWTPIDHSTQPSSNETQNRLKTCLNFCFRSTQIENLPIREILLTILKTIARDEFNYINGLLLAIIMSTSLPSQPASYFPTTALVRMSFSVYFKQTSYYRHRTTRRLDSELASSPRYVCTHWIS